MDSRQGVVLQGRKGCPRREGNGVSLVPSPPCPFPFSSLPGCRHSLLAPCALVHADDSEYSGGIRVGWGGVKVMGPRRESRTWWDRQGARAGRGGTGKVQGVRVCMCTCLPACMPALASVCVCRATKGPPLGACPGGPLGALPG
jgi:hypothetical protein